MLNVLTVLLLCQLAGELLILVTGWPIPGPVIGMLLLLAGLVLRGGMSEELDRVTAGLLDHLSLLFVPAGVGVMLHWTMIRAEWVAVLAALVLSTLLGLIATALTMKAVIRLRGPAGRSDV